MCPCTTYCFFVCLVSLGLLNFTSPPCEEEYLFEKNLEVPNENPLRLNINFNELSDILLNVGSPGNHVFKTINVCKNTYKTNTTINRRQHLFFFMKMSNDDEGLLLLYEWERGLYDEIIKLPRRLEPPCKLFMYGPTPQTKGRVVFGNTKQVSSRDCVAGDCGKIVVVFQKR